MKKFFQKYFSHILIGIFTAVFLALAGSFVQAIDERIAEKVSLSQIEKIEITQQANLDLIRKDIEHIEKIVEKQYGDSKAQFEKIDAKLERLILNNN